MKVITVNGKEYPFKEGSTLASLLDELNITPKHMAIEQNGVIIPGEFIADTAVNPGDTIEIIIEHSLIPVVVDAGLGMPSHAAEAIELGADFVLVNTAIAAARDPVKMANAFAKAVAAAEEALDAGPRAPQTTTSASSPLTGFLWNK